MFGWFKRKSAPPVLPVPVKTAGFFSTHHSAFTAKDDRPLSDSMRDYAFKRTQRDIVIAQPVVGDAGKLTFATDAAEWSGIGTAKGAYSLDGYGISDALASWYASQGFIGYQMCAIISQNWLVDKACTMPARDATRNGYEITVNDGTEITPEVKDYMRKLDKQFKVQMNAREAVRNMRIFGIRIVLFEVASSDPDYYLKPFNPDGVTAGSYKGMSQVDPYWITPELNFNAASNPASKHFYEPTYWRINGQRYHRSHLVIIKTCEVPDVLKPTYFYGGVPLPQRIAERIYAAERTANEAPQLALSKRSTVLHTDMDAAIANQADFSNSMQYWAYLRDNYGVKVVGTDEKIEQFDTALSDLDETIMTQYQIVCAIAEVPATKLLGMQSTGGIGNKGEYEESSYHEMLESIQEHDVRPILERHHILCIRSIVAPKFGMKPFETTVVFNELDAETAMEKAERHAKEAEGFLAMSRTGAVDGTDIRQIIISDEESGYNGLPAIMPEGPQNQQVVDPDAPKTAPNTPPGQTPTPAPAAPGGSSGQ